MVQGHEAGPGDMLQTFSVHGEWVMSFHSKGRSLQGDFKPPAVRLDIKNCTPLWRKAHSEVKMYKT